MPTFDGIYTELLIITYTKMEEPNYFKLRLTANTDKLYDYLTNSCLSYGSYLNPIKLGSFVHGVTDNTYTIGKNEVPAIDESFPEVDENYDGIKWIVSTSDWLGDGIDITAPKLQYIEIVNMNPFNDKRNLSYYRPMTERDWKGYFLPDDSGISNIGNSFTAAPNGHLFLTPSKVSKGRNISVLISQKKRNDGIIAMFNIGFTIKVDGVPYSCIIDPVLKVRRLKIPNG